MLHRFPLPHPWGPLSFLDLVEPVRETEAGNFYRHCLYLVDRRYKGGKQLIKQGPEFLIPKKEIAERPLQ